MFTIKNKIKKGFPNSRVLAIAPTRKLKTVQCQPRFPRKIWLLVTKFTNLTSIFAYNCVAKQEFITKITKHFFKCFKKFKIYRSHLSIIKIYFGQRVHFILLFGFNFFKNRFLIKKNFKNRWFIDIFRKYQDL